MNTIQAGKIYRQVDNKHCYRVFRVMPDEDLAIVARIECTSTRFRRLNLSRLNAALSQRQLIPVELIESPGPAPAEEIRSVATKAVFDPLRPALEELLAPGPFALSRRKMWPEFVAQSKKHNIPPSTLNLAFSRVLQAGGILEAAMPRWDKCGRKPSNTKNGKFLNGTNQPNSYHLCPRDFTNIAAGVRKFLTGDTTWQEAYDKFLEYYYPASETIICGIPTITPLPVGERPSKFQFEWHGLKLVPYEERMIQQMGKRVFDTSKRGSPNGQSVDAIYPGVVGEIDWTHTDVVGVSRGTRLSIGRFVFYAIVDVFSGAILSAYLTMGTGKASEAGSAIVQCLEDKVELCARYGLQITKEMWGIQFLCVELRSDRGEIDSWKSTGLGTALGMKLEYCPGKRPDCKGTIESFFRVVRYFLRRLRGGTSGHRERLKDHPNVTAIYDFDQVQKLLLTLAVAFNARIRRRQAMTVGMVAAQLKPVPNLICKWAQDRGCMRDFPLADAKLGALPTHFSSVTSEGIKIKGLRYVVPDFEPTEENGIDSNDWLAQARKGRWKVEVGIEPSTVNYIWLRHRPRIGAPATIKCELSREHDGWRDFSWIEYGLNKDEYRASIAQYQETALREIRAWSRGVIAATAAQAIAATAPEREGLSAAAQIAGTAERRELEMAGSAPNKHSYELATGDDFFDEAQWGKN